VRKEVKKTTPSREFTEFQRRRIGERLSPAADKCKTDRSGMVGKSSRDVVRLRVATGYGADLLASGAGLER
jgi:hypothetical protein